MRRRDTFLLMMMLFFVLVVPLGNASDSGLVTERQEIVISIAEAGLSIVEDITVNNQGSSNVTSIRFWIQQDAEEFSITAVDSGETLITSSVSGNERDCNLTTNDLVLTPQNRFGRQLRAYLATRWTDVEEDGWGHKIDQVISLRFPSYAVRHPSHVC